uniref:Uncharacterized protein n=1 Tax=Oryza nivara TaxID=4536 RepID=A0A0E0GKP0_ORYNI
MDQVEEKEGNRFQEPASDRCEDNEDKEQDNSEESSSVDQRKEEEEEEKEGCEEATPAAAAAAAAPSFFAHPCSLLQYIARVCACCLGLSDSFCDPKASTVLVPEPEPAAADPSQEGEEDMKSSVRGDHSGAGSAAKAEAAGQSERRERRQWRTPSLGSLLRSYARKKEAKSDDV